jgi:hypothetical protein
MNPRLRFGIALVAVLFGFRRVTSKPVCGVVEQALRVDLRCQ